ncbi:NAD(P)/FAD-dependent oxidoreductase [Rubinisphaera brasiliensis]|uniref:Monooxygenase n=1 Tax=Rubinisphaera brasiliensis (strain ATCC 49424 / DSM 5305 / JCM 21570 / IAM 15109 / NBRC 103401 / IFAM 1448) TaxID=756272 RepID=F0SHE7_RUBBR|nr:NAD(P)/FAD-dependent oxidoreductase [Rubinisphaera brasiliensis]ADY61702.1 monooxygenase [Rubinisphaera brasiliensis DSM 5305]
MNSNEPPFYDVVIVGGGAAGVGMGVALKHAGVENFVILDRHEIGATFDRWPEEMTFLTPSFPTNSIGMLDLNSVAIGTSPAYLLRKEHPSGREYAQYLRGVSNFYELPVKTGLDVQVVDPLDHEFRIQTSGGEFHAGFVIWAAGEFQYPHRSPFPGSEFCLHSSQVKAFRDYSHEEVVIIGGYESGVDAAIQLGALKKRVTVLSRGEPWDIDSSDPSVSLSTYTHERLNTVYKLGADIKMVGNVNVSSVICDEAGYHIKAEGNQHWTSPGPPIVATGFQGSYRLIAPLFEPREDDYPLLTEDDESTLTPGLFFAGPMVRHDQHIFCFIYKFRQRFAVVAKAIATDLGLPAEELEMYRQWGMYLDDLSCCGEECVC